MVNESLPGVLSIYPPFCSSTKYQVPPIIANCHPPRSPTVAATKNQDIIDEVVFLSSLVSDFVNGVGGLHANGVPYGHDGPHKDGGRHRLRRDPSRVQDRSEGPDHGSAGKAHGGPLKFTRPIGRLLVVGLIGVIAHSIYPVRTPPTGFQF